MATITPSKLNKFTFFKLPSAYWTGVRLKELTNEKAVTSVKYKWFNTNPFKSMYFAVQSMAAELSTGALVVKSTNDAKGSFAMLVMSHTGSFHKKATGRITFTCNDGATVEAAIQKAIDTNEPQLIKTTSIGKDQAGDIVSEYEFTWSVKKRSKK